MYAICNSLFLTDSRSRLSGTSTQHFNILTIFADNKLSATRTLQNHTHAHTHIHKAVIVNRTAPKYQTSTYLELFSWLTNLKM